MRVGIDIDGVLAEFNGSFMKRCVEVLGKDLFGPNYVPREWDYPLAAGYTEDQLDAVWKNIIADRFFWLALRPYPDTREALDGLGIFADGSYDIYFITARPGTRSKSQTENWLQMHGWLNGVPTVLVTPHKGLAVQTLDLQLYIDDKWENALQAKIAGAKSFLMDRPWNKQYDAALHGITRVTSVMEMFDGT